MSGTLKMIYNGLIEKQGKSPMQAISIIDRMITDLKAGKAKEQDENHSKSFDKFKGMMGIKE